MIDVESRLQSVALTTVGKHDGQIYTQLIAVQLPVSVSVFCFQSLHRDWDCIWAIPVKIVLEGWLAIQFFCGCGVSKHLNLMSACGVPPLPDIIYQNSLYSPYFSHVCKWRFQVCKNFFHRILNKLHFVEHLYICLQHSKDGAFLI